MSATISKVPTPAVVPSILQPNLFYKALLNGLVFHLVNKTMNTNNTYDRMGIITTGSVIASSLAFSVLEPNIPYFKTPDGSLDLPIIFGYRLQAKFKGRVIEKKLLEMIVVQYCVNIITIRKGGAFED